MTVSPTGDDTWNVVVWIDHRATAQAARIDATGHEVLRYVGGNGVAGDADPQAALARRAPARVVEASPRLLNLPDYLVYRATGVDVRSLCTTVCKWTYLGHDGRAGRPTSSGRSASAALADEGFARIGTRMRPMGERAGVLTECSARELGLAAGTPVAVAIIDAHAGGVGTLGAASPEAMAAIDTRLALIGGTSSCHMAVAREPRFVPGVWGPYWSAMVPGLWLAEAGQSATGALVDHVIFSHARGAELQREADGQARPCMPLLNERPRGSPRPALPAALARDLHVLPDHHGNRSPRADPSLRGMMSGLSLRRLARRAGAPLPGHGPGHRPRHAPHRRRAARPRLRDRHDPGVRRGHPQRRVPARARRRDRVPYRLAREPEAVLLGSAILGAVAAARSPSVESAMGAMTRAGRVIEPAQGEVACFHDAKHRVFLRMHDDQMAYRELMA